MSKIALEGNASGTGTFTIAAPNTSSNFTLTLPQATGTLILSQAAGGVATNTALGTDALAANTTGANNTAVGYQALDVNTTGQQNTAVGSGALTANTTGVENTAVGYAALTANTTGIRNNAVGIYALYSNTTGSANQAFGEAALYANTTGANNVAVGGQALRFNTTGANNTAVGYQALYANTTGANNTAVGYSALDSCTTGVDNVAVGDFCASNLTTGSGNICIQDLSDGASDRIFNVTTENNRIVMGHNYITNAYVKVAWTVTSDSRDKTSIESVPHGLSFVEQLNPVSYRWKTSREDDTPIGNRRYGFLAQEVMALEGDNPIIIDNETPEHLKYQGEALVPVLVNAIKELKAINDAQATRIETLETKVTALEAQLATPPAEPNA